VAIAAHIQEDLPRLARLRADLRQRMRMTLCDAERFTLELEEAYVAMSKAKGKPL
jgi:hypothetical protein